MSILPIGTHGKVRESKATIGLIIINVIIYLITSYENGFLSVGEKWVEEYSLIPITLLSYAQLYRVFTSMFLHGNIFHILFNMYFLYIFGREVESTLGSGRYLLLYFLSGVFATIFHIGFSGVMGIYNVLIPALGASGAISGVLGAYLLLYPRRSLTVCWFFWLIPWCFTMKAAYLLLFWFATQLIYGYTVGQGIAFFAHVGGFVFGIASLGFIIPRWIRSREVQMGYDYYTGTYYIIRRKGLDPSIKMILAGLLALLVIGAGYSTYTSSYLQANIYLYTIKAGYPSVGYNIDSAIYDLSRGITVYPTSDLPRIVINRLYWAGILNDGTNKSIKLKYNRYIKAKGYNIYVSLSLDAYLKYDSNGVLKSGEGVMKTDIIQVSPYGVSLKKGVDISFGISSIGPVGNIGSKLIQPVSIISLITILAAIYVVIKKDKELIIE